MMGKWTGIDLTEDQRPEGVMSKVQRSWGESGMADK